MTITILIRKNDSNSIKFKDWKWMETWTDIKRKYGYNIDHLYPIMDHSYPDGFLPGW